jgi:hypothetical protein
MSNKPIAWIDFRRGGIVTFDAVWASKVDDKKPIPLYTHPIKELTDEVKDALMDALSGWKYIRQCHGDLYGVGWDRVQEKLEAILRKASDK